ncbi:MAG: hypothetical protein RLY31_2900 [Bacteroidota bacterium]|jgi:hypothetical protein
MRHFELHPSGLLEKTGGGATSQLKILFKSSSAGMLAARSGILGFTHALVSNGRMRGNSIFLFPNGQSLAGTVAPDSWLTFLNDVTITDTLDIDIAGGVPDRPAINGNLTLAASAALRLSPVPEPLPAVTPLPQVKADNHYGTFGQMAAPCS